MDLLNSKQACEVLGVSCSTLWKLKRKKAFPSYKPNPGRNSKVYFNKKDLLQYLRAGRRKQGDNPNDESKDVNKGRIDILQQLHKVVTEYDKCGVSYEQAYKAITDAINNLRIKYVLIDWKQKEKL